MTWANLLVSAGISAVVGALVSILAVSRLTVGRLRAEQAETARRRVLATVRPLQLNVLRYRSGRKDMSRSADTFHSDDLLLVASVIESADGLRWPRRWLVVRRCRRIFGRECTNTAALYESEESALEHGAWLQPLFADAVSSRGRSRTFLDGLWHRALAAGKDSPLLATLSRELKRLAASW